MRSNLNISFWIYLFLGLHFVGTTDKTASLAKKPQFNLLMISSGQYVWRGLVRSEGQEWQNDWWPVKYDIMPVGSFIPAPRQWGHRRLLMTSSGFSEAASSTAACTASPCSDSHPQPAGALCVVQFLEFIRVLITDELLGCLAAFVPRLVALVAFFFFFFFLRISNTQLQHDWWFTGSDGGDGKAPGGVVQPWELCSVDTACPQRNRLTSVFALLWIIGGPKLSW